MPNQSLMQIESLNQSLAANNFLAVARIENSLSIRGSIEGGNQLQKLVRSNWEVVMKLLSRLIKNTAIFYNVSGNITDDQLVMISQTILDTYPGDNIEDVILALKTARTGRYGKLYGRLDGEVILNWISQFLETKSEEMEKLHHANKHKAPEMHTDILKLAKEAAEKKQQYQAPREQLVSQKTWLNWFDENFESFTVSELLELKKQLVNGSLHGANGAEINRISERLNQLERVEV